MTSGSVTVTLPAGTYKYAIAMTGQANVQTCSIKNNATGSTIASTNSDGQGHAAGSFDLASATSITLQANCYCGYSVVAVIPSQGKTSF